MQFRRRGDHASRTRWSADHFNIWQSPALVENRLLRAIHAEPRKPFFAGLGVKPIGRLTGRGLRAKVDVHGAVGVLAQVLVERSEGETFGVEKEAGRSQTIDRRRPKIADRHVRRNVEPVDFLAFQRLIVMVMKGGEIETAGA
jgi:hypothetical protein